MIQKERMINSISTLKYKNVSLKESALAYAEKDFAVFPVHYIDESGECTCGGKKDCTPGKHPMTKHGHKDATTDPDQIRAWWTRSKNANIGLNCKESGVIVIDTDPRSGGHRTLAALEEEHEKLPTTLTALTSYQDDVRGKHRYFRAPAGVKFKGTLGSGIDIKHNGYVILPPSIHPSGICYQWEDDSTEIADLPEWLLILLTDAGKAVKTPARGMPSGYSGSISDQYNLRVEDYLMPENGKYISSDEIRGSHPLHGSTTGKNLCINRRKNTWYCFRHQTGGGGAEAYAVAKGIIDCSEARPGCLQNHWNELFKCLEDEGFIQGMDTTIADEFLRFLERRRAFNARC